MAQTDKDGCKNCIRVNLCAWSLQSLAFFYIYWPGKKVGFLYSIRCNLYAKFECHPSINIGAIVHLMVSNFDCCWPQLIFWPSKVLVLTKVDPHTQSEVHPSFTINIIYWLLPMLTRFYLHHFQYILYSPRKVYVSSMKFNQVVLHELRPDMIFSLHNFKRVLNT